MPPKISKIPPIKITQLLMVGRGIRLNGALRK